MGDQLSPNSGWRGGERSAGACGATVMAHGYPFVKQEEVKSWAILPHAKSLCCLHWHLLSSWTLLLCVCLKPSCPASSMSSNEWFSNSVLLFSDWSNLLLKFCIYFCIFSILFFTIRILLGLLCISYLTGEFVLFLGFCWRLYPWSLLVCRVSLKSLFSIS